MTAIDRLVAYLTGSAAHSQQLIEAHRERERQDLFARLKAMYLEDNPQASASEFEAYTRLLAQELRL